MEFNPIHQTTKREIDRPYTQSLINDMDRLADVRSAFRHKNRSYYHELLSYFKSVIPEGTKILEVGCSDGYVLTELKPSSGLGIDFSKRMIEKARAQNINPNIIFTVADIECATFSETFDYILLSDLFSDLLDIQQSLNNLRTACHDDTLIIISFHNILWEPILKCVEKMGLKMPQKNANWLSRSDISSFLKLSDFEEVTFEKRLLIPKKIPVLANLFNKYLAPRPLINRFCLSHFLVIRKADKVPIKERSVSIIAPCKNERENIKPLILRMPRFGLKQEIIFVDGHSMDGTVEEIKSVIHENPDITIRWFAQEGSGKRDAVRLGFEKANHDILMILDADLTVPPEDLPKFYQAITGDKGDFINGSRLVYAVEKESMRFLNMLGNKFFAFVFSRMLKQEIKDTLCGTKVLFKADYLKISRDQHYIINFDPFGDFDLLFGAAKQKLRIIEVPVKYRSRTYGETNIKRFRHGWQLLKIVLFGYKKLRKL